MWKKVTDEVHSKGSYIWLQLGAMGRTADPNVLQREGSDSVTGASPYPLSANAPKSRAMTSTEIRASIAAYATAATNAVHKAGFDGVEVHTANGYLLDQYLQNVSNKRTDDWGGSVPNRSRFVLEATRAVIQAVGLGRTGLPLSPFSTFNGMGMADPLPQFSHLCEQLKVLELAYLHLIESRASGDGDAKGAAAQATKLDHLVKILGDTSPLLITGGFTPESARRAVDEEFHDKNVAVVFGRPFVSNPDLVFRVREQVPFAPYDRKSFYVVKSARGYVDYPFPGEWEKRKDQVVGVIARSDPSTTM